jgi:cell division protein FtsL
MWYKAVILAVKSPAVATYDWTEKDWDFETETLGKRMRVNGLADTKLIMQRGI